MDEMRKCTKCRKKKLLMQDFYLCLGRYRSECKACTIKRVKRYQQRVKPWKNRDDDGRRQYMRQYYAENKEKFAKYRASFRESHPEYFAEYFRKRKEK